MSAVSGVFHLDGSPVEVTGVQRMVAGLRPQGPDGEAVWHVGAAALGHNLFRSTTESAEEAQPCSLDGQVWITADAFLVGREELVETLRATGREASLARPDAELILHAYHAWGPAGVERLLGYFAFILWDAPARRVVAARDHFGNRTLYYAQRGSRLVLGSSLDAVTQHPEVGTELSEFHVGSFLALGSAAHLDAGGTAYQNVRRLRPAECLVAEGGAVRVRRYWECPAEVPLLDYRRPEEVVERYRALFARAIRDRLRSQRLAVTVSGGMDSTAVLAMTAHVLRERGHGPELVAFTQNHRTVNPTREAELAGKLCRQYDVPLTLMPMDEVPWLKPDYRPVTLAAYPLAARQQEYIRRLARLAPVAMFGSSGDMQRTAHLSLAWHGQSPWSAVSGFVSAWRQLGRPPPLNLGVGRLWKFLSRRRSHYDRHFPAWLRPELLARHDFATRFAEASLPELDPQLPRNRRHPHLQYWCARKDNGTVLHGNAPDAALDGLDPLGDKRLVEFYLALPLLPWLGNKFLQREAMRGLLPDEIRLRPRTEITSHHAPFLRNPANAWVDDWTAPPAAEPFLDRAAVPRLVGTAVPPHAAVCHLRALIFCLWLRGGEST